MTVYKVAFDTYEIITPHNVRLDDNNIVQTIWMRSIVVKSILESKINQIHIKNVLYVPKLHANLLSVNKLMSNGLNVQFNLNEWIVKSYNDEVIAIIPRKCNLYEINFVKVHEAETTNLMQFQQEMTLSNFGTTALAIWTCMVFIPSKT